MMMSVRSEGQFNSIIYEESDSYRNCAHRQVVMINPQDISRLGLVEGEKVNLRSAHGVLEGLQVTAFDVPETNLMAYYPEVNVLIGLAQDPRSKTPAFKSQPVRVEPQ